MRWVRTALVMLAVVTAFVLGWVLNGHAEPKEKEGDAIKGWKKGTGWRWIWGKDDEVGSLNAMTPETIKAALQLAKTGKVYDLGVPYDRTSFKWPGHSPGEVMTFRSPEGVKRQGDFTFAHAVISSNAGAWSDGRSQRRGSRSMLAPTKRGRNASLARTRSMRSPRLRRNAAWR